MQHELSSRHWEHAFLTHLVNGLSEWRDQYDVFTKGTFSHTYWFLLDEDYVYTYWFLLDVDYVYQNTRSYIHICVKCKHGENWWGIVSKDVDMSDLAVFVLRMSTHKSMFPHWTCFI